MTYDLTLYKHMNTTPQDNKKQLQVPQNKGRPTQTNNHPQKQTTLHNEWTSTIYTFFQTHSFIT